MLNEILHYVVLHNVIYYIYLSYISDLFSQLWFNTADDDIGL